MQRTKSDNHKKQKLKPQHQIVVEELAKGKSQTDAYLVAYPQVKSRKVAQVNAARLLSNAIISEAVQNRIRLALANTNVTPEEIVGSAARQMRSSIDDTLNEQGSFDIKKARETGAIDFLKKHKETIRSTFNPQTGETQTIKIVEIEMLTNESGRKEVAGYMTLTKDKANLERPAQVAKFINNCFTELEAKVAADPTNLPNFTRQYVINTFCAKCDVSPELVAPLVRECLLLED